MDIKIFNNSEEVDAELVGSDQSYDIAVLEIKTDKTLTGGTNE